jgi:hypothetical protein
VGAQHYVVPQTDTVDEEKIVALKYKVNLVKVCGRGCSLSFELEAVFLNF